MDVATLANKSQTKILDAANAYIRTMQANSRPIERITLYREDYDALMGRAEASAKAQKREPPSELTYRGYPLHRGEPRL